MMLEANTDNINERDTKTRGSPSNWINCQGVQSFPMNICNITVGERAVGYNSEDKPKSYQIPESQRDAILKPVEGRQHLVEDLHQTQRSLGSRYRQLMKVSLPESFNFTVYSARDLVNDIRSVQKQLVEAFPGLKRLMRLLKVKHSNIDTAYNLHRDDKPSLSVSDLFKLKAFVRMLVYSVLVVMQADRTRSHD